MEQFEQESRFAKEATKAVNPFSKFPGPDGEYYAELARITGGVNPKDGSLKIVAVFCIIGMVENNNQDFAGYTVRLQFMLRDSANSTKQEAYDRLYVNLYQALGCVTASWAKMSNPDGSPKSITQTMAEESDRLNAEHPVVMLSITENKKDARFQNINIREILKPDAVSHLTRPNISVSDADAMADDEGAEQVTEDFSARIAAAQSALEALDVAGLLDTIKEHELDLDAEKVSALPIGQLRELVLKSYCDKAGYDYTPITETVPFDTAATKAAELVSAAESVEEAEEALEEASEELMETLEEALEPSLEETLTAQAKDMARKPLQLAIRAMDASSKFFASQTDEDLRKWWVALSLKAAE
jgi:hypothetical protein